MTPEKLKQLKELFKRVFDEEKSTKSPHQKEFADKGFRSLDAAANGLSDPYQNRQELSDEIIRALTYLGEAGIYGSKGKPKI